MTAASPVWCACTTRFGQWPPTCSAAWWRDRRRPSRRVAALGRGAGARPSEGPVQGPLQSHGVAGRVYPWTSSAAIVAGSYCPFATIGRCGPPAVPARPQWLLCGGSAFGRHLCRSVNVATAPPLERFTCAHQIDPPCQQSIAAQRAVGARQRGHISNVEHWAFFSRQTSACQPAKLVNVCGLTSSGVSDFAIECETVGQFLRAKLGQFR